MKHIYTFFFFFGHHNDEHKYYNYLKKKERKKENLELREIGGHVVVDYKYLV